ncbi:hypothetical protein FA95DRAFT_1057450 [Auriscalpium vulgare]|uniref:Uncharacterized protein n=1 Tax=Auriscalpium vulgare TaxID=40419 RepID=A0ACB8S975_9AGAM|nr:hypothetical protein FA95DRAFT_1057450 [Auriscalpium vulgare]
MSYLTRRQPVLDIAADTLDGPDGHVFKGHFLGLPRILRCTGVCTSLPICLRPPLCSSSSPLSSLLLVGSFHVTKRTKTCRKSSYKKICHSRLSNPFILSPSLPVASVCSLFIEHCLTSVVTFTLTSATCFESVVRSICIPCLDHLYCGILL